MQQRGLNFLRVDFFLRDLVGDYSTYIHGYLCLTFLLHLGTFDFCFLTFCSLGTNQISAKGVHAVAAALQVNQSLQELK